MLLATATSDHKTQSPEQLSRRPIGWEGPTLHGWPNGTQKDLMPLVAQACGEIFLRPSTTGTDASSVPVPQTKQPIAARHAKCRPRNSRNASQTLETNVSRYCLCNGRNMQPLCCTHVACSAARCVAFESVSVLSFLAPRFCYGCNGSRTYAT